MSEEFKIEDNVPLPDIVGRPVLGPLHEALKKIEVGQSFFVPLDPTRRVGLTQAKVHTFGTVTGRKFITRSVEGGLRVWRKV